MKSVVSSVLNLPQSCYSLAGKSQGGHLSFHCVRSSPATHSHGGGGGVWMIWADHRKRVLSTKRRLGPCWRGEQSKRSQMELKKELDSDGGDSDSQNLVEIQERRRDRIQGKTETQTCSPPPPCSRKQGGGECSQTAAEVSIDKWRQGGSVPKEENIDYFHLVAARCFSFTAGESFRHHIFQWPCVSNRLCLCLLVIH